MSTPYAFIIEDDETLAELFSITLQQAGFETFIAPDGQRALQRLHFTAPDLIVLDLHLSKVSAQLVLAYIRTNDRLCQIPVFLATAHTPLAEMLATKSDIVLLKPVRLTQLRLSAQRVAAQSSR